MLVDSMKLAYETFQGCRLGAPYSEALLTALIPTLEEVRESGMLVLDVPDSRIEPLPSGFKEVIECDPDVERKTPRSRDQQWVNLCYISAVELRRLWAAGAHGAVRSLGYAMHEVPNEISLGGSPTDWDFEFRVAAFHWSDFSSATHDALANIADFDVDRVDKLVQREGFAVDMHGYSRSREGPNGNSGNAAYNPVHLLKVIGKFTDKS